MEYTDDELSQYLPDRAGSQNPGETERMRRRDLKLLRRYIAASGEAQTEKQAIEAVMAEVDSDLVRPSVVNAATRKWRMEHRDEWKTKAARPASVVDQEARDVLLALARRAGVINVEHDWDTLVSLSRHVSDTVRQFGNEPPRG